MGVATRFRPRACALALRALALQLSRSGSVSPGFSVGRAGCAQAREASHSDCRAQNHFILQMCDSNFVPCHIIIMALVQSFLVASLPRESL